ncbi:MAG TPA: glycosyltransferase [Gammaproteobacteria bacterium]|nr:glycosyltransferase [Gammaproteobacteria bacterium]
MGKRIVITCWGSHGDLFPYIGLAVALKRHGHSPVVATNSGYRGEVEREGIEFAQAGPTIDASTPNARELYERVMDPVKGSEVIIKELLMPQLDESFEQLSRAAEGADLLLSHPITYAAPVVADYARLPWLSTVLAPMLFFSKHDPPVLPALPRVNDLPLVGTWLVRALVPLARRATRDWGEPVHTLRAKLGLPRGLDPVFEGQFSPHGTLALFSRVLGAPQPDWPPNVTTTGTVFYNAPEPLESTLEDFLSAGDPPVVFTLGTSAVGAAGGFYHESAAAAEKLGVRAVLLTGGFAQNRPDRLPPNVLLVDRAPHQLLFPRASAVVHQCGAGTTAQALRSGKPTLLVPHGHDQFDNARRVRKLGVARVVLPKYYRAERVARDLRALLDDVRYQERASAVSIVVREERGAEAAVAVIEKLLSFSPARAHSHRH